MRFIDTHCHLYLNDFKNDLDEVMQRARNAGLARFYMPSIDSSCTTDLLHLEAIYKEECYPMMGLHPCSVKESFRSELSMVEAWLNKRNFVAIGEIGLDFHWDKSFVKEQYQALEQQMELALQHNLPVVLHTRDAMQETIDTVKPFADKGLSGIFHCFGDGYATAKKIMDMGFLLGIGGVITYKKSGLAETIKKIDLKHLVLETDAPYLTPVPYRGKRNESSYLLYVANAIADAKGISVEEVAEITAANAEKLFGH